MKLHIKNQLNEKIEFCCGEKEYSLNPEQEISIEVKDEDCMYLDQFHSEKVDGGIKNLVDRLKQCGAQDKVMLQIIDIAKRAMEAEAEIARYKKIVGSWLCDTPEELKREVFDRAARVEKAEYELAAAKAREVQLTDALSKWKYLAHFMKSPTDWRTGETLADLYQQCIQAGERALSVDDRICKPMRFYISSSWKNRNTVRKLAIKLRELGCEAYDFTDPACRKAPKIPPEKFPEEFDPDRHVYSRYINQPEWYDAVVENKKAIEQADFIILLLPCGNDSHADWAYGVGLGKKSAVVGHPRKGERSPVHLWADVMTNSVEEFFTWLELEVEKC